MLDPHFNSMSLKGKIPLGFFSVGELNIWIEICIMSSFAPLLTSFIPKHYFSLSFHSPRPKYTRLFLALMNLQNPAQPSAS